MRRHEAAHGTLVSRLSVGGDPLDLLDDALESIRYFSPRHRAYVKAIVAATVTTYDVSLEGLALYGSYARGEQRLNSDLDLMIILADAPGIGRRIQTFVEAVELPNEGLAVELLRTDGVFMEASPYILTEAEALYFQPIYLDLVDAHLILLDPHGLIAHIISAVAQLRQREGAHREPVGTRWAWSTGRFLGGVRL